MGKFWLYQSPANIGVREGQRGARMEQPRAFDSLSDAQSVPVPPGFRAWIEGPDGSYAYVSGQWSARFSRAEVLEGVEEPSVDPQHIVLRVNDWAARINGLYAQLESWLPAGWRAERGGMVRMHEELMRANDVPPRDLPILNLVSDGGQFKRIEPRGLWIIGANGRLDLSGGGDHYVIVDMARKFAPPLWHIARFSDRNLLRPLTKENFIEAL